MDVTSFNFLDNCETTSAIPRRVYKLVNDFYVSGCQVQPQFSLLQLFVCTTQLASPDFIVTKEQFINALRYLPVYVFCGGYAAGSGVSKGDSAATRLLPAPLTRSHYDRLIGLVRRTADRLKIRLVGVDDLTAQYNIVLQAALSSKFLEALEPQAMMRLPIDDKNSARPVYLCGSTAKILVDTLADWFKIPLFEPAIVSCDASSVVIKLSMTDDSFSYPIILHPSEQLGSHVEKTHTNNPWPEYQFNEKKERAAQARMSKAVRLLQMEFDTAHKKVQLTVTQAKLFEIIKILGTYYKQSVFSYMKGARVLDLCSDPGNMTVLMAELGAVVEVQSDILNPNWLNMPNVTRTQAVPNLFSFVNFNSNIRDEAILNSFSLIVGDGHRDDENQMLFWAQVYAAVRLIGASGSVIVKTVCNPCQLFEQGHKFLDAQMSVEDRASVFTQFAHWGIVKPAASRFYNQEVYFLFLGYRGYRATKPWRSVYNAVSKAYEKLSAHRHICDGCIEKQSSAEVYIFEEMGGFLDNFTTEPSNPAIYKDHDYRTVIRASIARGSHDYPRALAPVIADWAIHFKSMGEFIYEDIHYDINMPPEMSRIYVSHEQNTLYIMARYMYWLIHAPKRDNHKAFIAEFCALNKIDLKFSFTPSSSGPPHNLVWVGMLESRVVSSKIQQYAPYFDNFVAHSVNRSTKKEAEQECYRQYVEHVTRSKIHWAGAQHSTEAIAMAFHASVFIRANPGCEFSAIKRNIHQDPRFKGVHKAEIRNALTIIDGLVCRNNSYTIATKSLNPQN